MSNFPLSYFINNPDRFKFFNKNELRRFAKKNWQYDIDYNCFIQKYLKYSYAEKKNRNSGTVQRLLQAISIAMGYSSITEFNNHHNDSYHIAIEKINRIELPDTSSTVVKMGGFHSGDYEEEQFINEILINHKELIEVYELLEDLHCWIGIRKNGVLQHPAVRKTLKNYSIVTLIKDAGISHLREENPRYKHSDLFLASLHHFNIINLPDKWSYRLETSKKSIKNIDHHHVVGPNNKYLRLRHRVGLCNSYSAVFSSIKISNPAIHELVALLNSHYKPLLQVIENEIDITYGQKEVFEKKFSNSRDFLHCLKAESKELIDTFYNNVCSFSEYELYPIFTGIEFIRIAIILLASINNRKLFETLFTIQFYLNCGLAIINSMMEHEKKLSITKNMPQFI